MDKDTILKVLPPNNRMKEYLYKLDTKEWSLDEFNKECAYWLISCDDLEPLPLPTRPQELKEYDTWSPTEKKNTSDKFWRQDRVFNYLNQKQFVLDRNKGMLDKLKEFKKYIPKEDIIARAKYDRIITMYSAPEEMKEALDTFGGEIIERGCQPF